MADDEKLQSTEPALEQAQPHKEETRGSEPVAQRPSMEDGQGLPPVYETGFGDAEGAPTRSWLNEHVTPALTQAMRIVSRERPEQPLRRLADLLTQYADEKDRS